jgi:crotonobetainyl-CoA:carnitine CoA-transferase CaiB-like acyl-CoA transferase
MMLADHGAHVIALEDKRFIADDLYPTPLYRNKEHISLNLKSRGGKEVFSRLVKDVDILMEGFRIYETKDNRYISIGAVENRFWKQLCEFLGVPDLAPLQFDDTRRREIVDFMRSSFKKKSLDQCCKTLGDLDACWAPVQRLAISACL